jgi:hypothetical protein
MDATARCCTVDDDAWRGKSTREVRQMDLSTWSLLVGCFCLSAIAGTGIVQSLFVMPSHFRSPPGSLEAFQKDRSLVF